MARVPALHLDSIGKRFGPRWVLRDVTFDVGAGESVALLGPNGCGKTTLLRIAATVSRAQVGRLAVCGVDAQLHPERARAALSYLPQVTPLYAEFTAREHLTWWGRMHGSSLPVPEAEAVLEDAGLAAQANMRTQALSRGQRQRLGLAMALLNHPPVLLLDEPFAALDAAGREWLERRLAQRKGSGATLVASHEPEIVGRFCDRILKVGDSRVEAAS